MRIIVFVVVALLGLVCLLAGGCSKPAQKSESVGVEFVVDTLFTHQGCTVYRFWGGGYPRYYTNCRGGADWQEQHGKASIHQSIPTER